MSEENSTTKETDVNTGVNTNENADANTENIIKLSPDTLPKNTVHCYPAKKALILRRRVISFVLGLGFLLATIYFFIPANLSFVLAGFAGVDTIICVLVFIQTFLIASYRVALDYEKNEVVLRYMFQKIHIPFEDFDTKEGQPDRAEAQLSRIFLRPQQAAVRYLILDNVRESACYQTTSKDLAGNEDFNQLKIEAENIRDVFRGRPSLPPEPVPEEDEMTRIINSALKDEPKNIDEKGK
jgi:hypothetical protein